LTGRCSDQLNYNPRVKELSKCTTYLLEERAELRLPLSLKGIFLKEKKGLRPQNSQKEKAYVSLKSESVRS